MLREIKSNKLKTSQGNRLDQTERNLIRVVVDPLHLSTQIQVYAQKLILMWDKASKVSLVQTSKQFLIKKKALKVFTS